MKNLKTVQKKKYSALVLLGIFILFMCGTNAFAQGKLLRGEKWHKFSIENNTADFYVAMNGNDSWSGKLASPNTSKTDGPFASIQRAQKAVIDLKSEVFFPKEDPVEKRWIGSPHPLGKGRDILVLIRGGYYPLTTSLLFTPEDGGERVETNLPTGAFEYHKLKDYYVTYAAYPGEKPVITGGPVIPSWEKGKKTWKSKIEEDNVDVLVINGQKQTLARTPNSGYFIPPEISETPDKLYFNKGELKNWKEMEGNRVFMLLRWHHGVNSFKRIDEKSSTGWLEKPQDGVVIVPPRYFVENVKALMDSPGEWFFDSKAKELEYIPTPELIDAAKIIAVLPQLENIVSISGERGNPIRNLRIYGLTFEGTLQGSTGIELKYAHSCELVDSEFRSMGGTGLYLGIGCYQSRILGNTFQTIDNMAIRIHGPEQPENGKDILRETTVSYNKIYDCGGVNIEAAFSLFTTISHNYITKTRGRYAISVGGWHNLEEAIDGSYLVEYNHLDDVQKDADDSGAIKTAGTTFNSVVRKNLIHDVRAGFFNDNVGFWFDNMSLDWVAEDNIFYNLEQGEMKLCAANLVDNLYQINFVIDAPKNAPEQIINGEPEFEYSDFEISIPGVSTSNIVTAGTEIVLSANIFNHGSSGILPVELYLDGKIIEKKSFPSIHKNTSKIEFELRVYEDGKHQLAIGDSPYKEIVVEGEKPMVVFEELQVSDSKILHGESVKISAIARNLTSSENDKEVKLYLSNQEYKTRKIKLAGGESVEVEFEISPEVGDYSVRISNSKEVDLTISDWEKLDMMKVALYDYCSAKAKPFSIESSPEKNSYKIKASGSDFFHAEDSYASIFLKQIKGDFVATVKIKQFGERTHEWFRAGLFARNDITKSFDTQPGSKGSVLVFGTPGRAGIHYDEFGNGCMHKANSENLPENTKFPIWLKLARYGNSFSSWVSLDGENWIIERRTADIPGIAESIDLGLAAGSPDKEQYWVEFTDWDVKISK